MLRSQELQTKIFAMREQRDKAQRDYMAVEPTERAAAEPAYRTAVGDLDASIGRQTAALGEAWAAEEREQVELRATVARIGAGDMPSVPPEMRSFIALEQRASLGVFVERDLSDMGAVLAGAEAEFRAATIEEIGGQHPAMPNPILWSMFLAPEKLRAIREAQVKLRAVLGGTPTGGTMQDPIIEDIFAASTAAFLGTAFKSAGTGQVIEYVLTSSGATLTAAAAAHTAAGSLSATTLEPHSIRSKYELNVEQVATIQGLDAAIRADVPRAIMAHIDNQVLNRGGTNRFSNGILRAFTLPTTDNTVLTFANSLGKALSGIDGKYARSPKELKIVVGPETMQRFVALISANTAVSVFDYLRMNTGGVMATDHIDVHTTANQYGIICKTGPGMMGNIAARMWGGGVQIKRDDSSSAVAELGQVHINATALADFAVLRTAGFELFDAETTT